MVVLCDCAVAVRSVAMTAALHSSAVAKRMRKFIPESPLQSDRRVLAGATCAAINARCRDKWPRTHQSLDPTVKVFSNIGSDRIGTLLFFVIKLTSGKTVRTGSSDKLCADGKVLHETHSSNGLLAGREVGLNPPFER
jgi:hypothetical protein